MANFTIKWDVGLGVTRQELLLKKKYGEEDWSVVAILNSGINTYTLKGLNENTIYLFKINSICDGGNISSETIELIAFSCPNIIIEPTCGNAINYSFTHLGFDVDIYDIFLYDNNNNVLSAQTKIAEDVISGSFTNLDVPSAYKIGVVPKADEHSKTDCQLTEVDVFFDAPTVITNPQGAAMCDDGPNSIITLTAAFSGSSLTYSWYRNGEIISDNENYSGANTPSLTIKNAGSILGSFTCKAENACGFVITNPAVITSLSDTVINIQPSAIPSCITEPITLSVNATGESVTYQWEISINGGIFQPIDGANSSTYTIINPIEGNKYRVRVNSECGPEIISSEINVNTVSIPIINEQPVSEIVCEGTNGTFIVNYTLEDGFVNWQKFDNDWVDINGANSNIYITNIPGNYRLKIVNVCSTIYSNAVSLSNYIPIGWETTADDNISACAGANVSITNTVTGSNPVYQWFVSNDNGITYNIINGAVSPTLSLLNINYSMNGNKYKLIAIGPCNNISHVTTLVVHQGASITNQPQNQSVCSGNIAAFYVDATSNTEITYQWEYLDNGVWRPISGATNNVYSFVTSASDDGKLYRVVINSCGGVVISNVVSLSIIDNLVWNNVTTNPTACQNDNITIYAITSGELISQIWQKSVDGGVTWVTLTGETGNSLQLSNVQYSQNNEYYRSVATGVCNSITSNNIVLNVKEFASITQQPVNKIVCNGLIATFSVTTTGWVSNYQWQKSIDNGTTWVNVNGGTDRTLNVSTSSANNGELYRVEVRGCNTILSNSAILTVNELVVITSQPTSQTVCENGSATFSVSATGTNLSYQWQTYNGSQWINISGATSNNLYISAIPLSANGRLYRVVISGYCNVVNSVSVLLSVTSGAANWVNRNIEVYWVCVGMDKYYQQIDSNPCSSTYNNTRTGAIYQANNVDCGYTPPSSCNAPSIGNVSIASINNCNCPDNYQPSPDLSECVQPVEVSSIPPTATTEQRTLVKKTYFNYGTMFTAVYTGGFNPDIGIPTGSTLTSSSQFWKNSLSNYTDGPLNRCAVWSNLTTDNQRIGFSICLNTTQEKIYLVGVGCDNYASIKVNGNYVLKQNANALGEYWLGDHSNKTTTFTIWHIYPIYIPAGNNIIEVSGNNVEGIASVGVEIYDGTASQILSAQSYEDFGPRLLFSTKDIVGSLVVGGNNNIGYTCPDDSYIIKSCNVYTPVCYKVLTLPCEI